MYCQALWLGTGVLEIRNLHLQTFRHGFHHSSQVHMTGRHILHRHPSGQPFLAKVEHVVDRECVDQPCSFCVLVRNVLSITDEIPVGAPVALDLYAEHLFHSLSVVVEGAS